MRALRKGVHARISRSIVAASGFGADGHNAASGAEGGVDNVLFAEGRPAVARVVMNGNFFAVAGQP